MDNRKFNIGWWSAFIAVHLVNVLTKLTDNFGIEVLIISIVFLIANIVGLKLANRKDS